MVKPEVIVAAFSKYCRECVGAMCCKSNVMTVFECELGPLLRFGLDEAAVCENWGGQLRCKNIDLNNGCSFLSDTGCKLPAEVRPIDCLTYPFYPDTDLLPDIKFMINSGCPKSEQMRNDFELIQIVSEKWESELGHISHSDVIDWLADNSEWKKELVEVKGR